MGVETKVMKAKWGVLERWKGKGKRRETEGADGNMIKVHCMHIWKQHNETESINRRISVQAGPGINARPSPKNN
jgi:hypothetical protein